MSVQINMANTYKSQKGQDKWVIEEVLSYKKNGYFLDLAAADGGKNSNTFVLEKEYNWNGLAIEPNPSYYEALCKRRDCTKSNCVISDKSEKVLFRVDNNQLGGIVSENTDNSHRVRGNQLKSSKCRIIELDSYLLIDVLKENNAPSVIDYWSLDIEGSEEAVISSFDFSQYTFGCITIERPTPLCNKILQDNGYVFVKNYLNDSFYVHSKYQDKVSLKKFEQIPPKDW